jgi:hypothetical protein
VTPFGALLDCGCQWRPLFRTDMGHARRRPKRLAEKFIADSYYAVFVSKGNGKAVGDGTTLQEYLEVRTDKGGPPMEVLLAYARVANVALAQIVDDDADL